MQILDEIQKTMTESECEPEQFKGKIIFMSMYNDIGCVKTRTQRRLYCECSQSYWVCSKESREDNWLDRRRNGTELMSTNLMENGRKLLKAWCSTLPKADLYSVLPTHWKEENWKSRVMITVWIDSSNNYYPSISSVLYGAAVDLCEELAGDSRGYGETRSEWEFGINGYTDRIFYC